MYSEREPIFSFQINLERFQAACLYTIGQTEIGFKIPDIFNDITSFTMALLASVI